MNIIPYGHETAKDNNDTRRQWGGIACTHIGKIINFLYYWFTLHNAAQHPPKEVPKIGLPIKITNESHMLP